jgi:hypothetical protein
MKLWRWRRTGNVHSFLWGTKWRLEFKPQDLWIGIFWKTTPISSYKSQTDVYVCLLPMLPLHWWWVR